MAATESEDGVLRLQLSIEFHDIYHRSQRKRTTNSKKVAVWLIFFLLVAGMALFAATDSWSTDLRENVVFITFWTLFFGAITLAGLLRRRLHHARAERRLRQRWERAGKNRNCVVELSPAGVVWQTDGERVELEWRTYQTHVENSDYFLLYAASGQISLIPKRFISREQLPILRELLRRFASQAKGFPVQAISSQPTSSSQPIPASAVQTEMESP